MPAVIPAELKKDNWEKIKKTFAPPHNTDATIAPLLTTLGAAAAAPNWTILEGAVDSANNAATSVLRTQVITAANAQLAKLGKIGDEAVKLQTALKKLFSGGLESPAAEKVHKAAVEFKKWVAGFETQTRTQLANSLSQAANRAAGLNLAKVLANPALKSLFQAFCASEFSSENFDFLETFKKGPNQALYTTFVPANAPRQVNLPADVRGALDADAAGGVYNQLAHWKAAYDAIFNMLNNDTMNRFKATL